MANPPRRRNWQEEWLANGWIFEEYRHTRQFSNYPKDKVIEKERHKWAGRILPLPGRFRHLRYRMINGVKEPIWQPQRLPVESVCGNPDILGTPLRPGDPGYAEWDHAKIKYNQMRTSFFRRNRGLTVIAPLGYGGNGLVTKCQYKENSSAAVLTFVVKIALSGWDSPDLYLENKVTEVFNRAAHMVQAIPRSRVGLPPQERYPHPLLYENDDSSSPESDSGDESPNDQPSEKFVINATLTRGEQMVERAKQFNKKQKIYKNRMFRHNILVKERNFQVDTGNPDPKWQPYRRDFLLLEYLENGDLEKLLARLNEKEIDIPNRVTRACLAMQFPPRKFHPGRHEDHPVLQPNGQPDFDLTGTGKRLGDELYEQEPPPKRRWAAKRYVHFDIDPKNILIGGFDPGAKDGEHALVPKLKLADFGLTENIKTHKRNNYYKTRRRSGKWGYYAPEQFGAEWDYIRRDDGGLPQANGPEISEQPIAGNYGSPMNVWGIGLTMWQLITKLQVPRPLPLQMSGVSQIQMPNHYCAEILTNAKYNRVDLELRQTVAKCLAHDPKYRPQPRVLANQAKRKLKKRFPGETDEVIREWVQAIILNA
ncbi:kinase-like domain-containing protein [Xylaria sp. FL0043]|nr:kinase-like domain-containing protein [Xylaria sp. FL0043]